MSEKLTGKSISGMVFAFTSFIIWGLSPVVWKQASHVPVFEGLLHRIVWSFLFLLPILIFTHRTKTFVSAVKSPKVMAILLGTTLIISSNWFVYIWAIINNHILQTSLGYYIAPLFNVLLGMVFLKETLRKAQVAAVAIAFVAVLYMTFSLGEFPWISIWLAITFGFYGLIRKVAPVGSLEGLAIETMILTIPAFAWLVYLWAQGEGAFLRISMSTDITLMSTALVTALPLLLFTVGARRIHYVTVGFLLYVAPSCSFLLAVICYKEPLGLERIITFIFIWTALIIFSIDSVVFYKKSIRENE